MIRPAATLLALLATFAAAPAQAQQSAPATPLPALLQPDSGAWRQSTVPQTPISGPLRGAIIGMGVGCVLLGALWVTTDSDTDARETVGSRTVSTEPVEINPDDDVLEQALAGCGVGGLLGGALGFTFGAIQQGAR